MSTAVCLLAHRRRGEIRVFLKFCLRVFFSCLDSEQPQTHASTPSQNETLYEKIEKIPKFKVFFFGRFFLWRRFPNHYSSFAATGISKNARPPMEQQKNMLIGALTQGVTACTQFCLKQIYIHRYSTVSVVSLLRKPPFLRKPPLIKIGE